MLNSYSVQEWFYPLFIFLILMVFISCENESEYEQLVERELNKDVRHDTLFLGYEFGMESEDFFNHSWELNQQQVVTGGDQIEYEIEELSSPARMIFYPEFHDNRIYRMPVEISYKSWAPWNRELYSDSLITELLEWYRDIYGPGFIRTTHPEIKKEAWIKVDGNRRISIYRKDDMKVRVEFLDLSVNQEK